MSDGCTTATAPRIPRRARRRWPKRSRAWTVAAGTLAAFVSQDGLAAPSDPIPPSDGKTVSEVIVSAPKTVSELVVTASKTVSELVVTAPLKCRGHEKVNSAAERPNVVSTYPENGQMVRPGLVMVRITFDAQVACAGGPSDDPPLPNPCPGAVQKMVLSYDRRTVRTICRLDPDRRYGAWLSRTPQNSFLSLAGLQARPFRLEFASSLEAPVTTVCEAVAQDAFTAREIETRRKLDCGDPPDEAAARIAADVRRQDELARHALELARAQAEVRAEAQRVRLEARELEEAQTLARADYAKALRQKRADYDLAMSQTRRAALDKPDSQSAGPDITPPSRAGGSLDPRALAASAVHAAPKPSNWGPAPPPDVALADWSISYIIDGYRFVCGRQESVVTCRRS